MIEENPVAQFLQVRFNTAISDITQIGAGMFSQAFSFKLPQQEFVFRLNQYEEDFQKDIFAHQCFSSQVPVPKVVACDRFDHNYYFAITERCAGKTLNALGETSVQKILPSLFETLHTLHSVDTSAYSGWGLTDANGYGRFASWKDYLLSFYNQKFPFTWEELFDRTCMERSLFERCFSVMQDYLPFCAKDKYWVHGDFGFDNVMSDGKEITGVLDWAESRLGDFVYDIAYLEFWSKNIPYKRLWLEWAEDHRLSISHFEERMRCYLIHIGLAGLAIAAIREDTEDYTKVKARLQAIESRVSIDR
jgi:hygromycin-B 4-O-kinase